jgi:peptidoglycan/xylan/chitin deacetylase (PgdA/CDA1 family)
LKKSFIKFFIFIGLTFLGVYFFDLGKGLFIFPFAVLLSDFVMGAILIENNFYINSVNFLPQQKTRQLCLTFDDGIHAELTPKVLDILKQKNVKAIFFLIGKNIQGNETIVKRMHEEGHQIGNHSFEHSFWFDMKSSKAMLVEIEQTNQVLESVIGEKIKLFRPPYGVTNPNLAKAIKQSGLQSIGWSLRTFDTTAKTKQKLLVKLKQNTKDRDIVLLHDRCEITADSLTEYIDFCLDRGFTFVTLNE